METLHQSLLVVHILSGAAALIGGALAMTARKGGGTHRIAGRVFFYGMLGVSFTAVPMTLIHPSTFLLLIAGFSLYQVLNGERALRNKAQRPQWKDWTITALGAISGVAMLTTGNVVLMVFGGIAAVNVTVDLRTYVSVLRGLRVPGNTWLRKHIGHMMGGYIAASTAFLVQNASGLGPWWLVWLAPTFIGVPLLVMWTRRFTRRPPAVTAQNG